MAKLFTLGISGIVGWFARAPYRGYHMIGEALQWAGEDKIVMGLDLPFDDMGKAVNYIRTLQMPDELREKWGYPEITDQMRAKFLGQTLAKLAKIRPNKRVGKKKGAAKIVKKTVKKKSKRSKAKKSR